MADMRKENQNQCGSLDIAWLEVDPVAAHGYFSLNIFGHKNNEHLF